MMAVSQPAEAQAMTIVNTSTTAMVLDGDSMDKMLKFSRMMATSKITIPKHLQGNEGDCFAIVMQSMQWGMNPFAVAQKTHLVSGVLGYEAQLIKAVIDNRAPITGRLNYEWFGDWSKVQGKTDNSDEVGVLVSATMRGEAEPRVLRLSMAQVGAVRNSPLWVADPRQQLAYLATKRWSRLHCPDVILGVYTDDELVEPKDVTPAHTSPAPASSKTASIRDKVAAKKQGQVVDGKATGQVVDGKATAMPAEKTVTDLDKALCAIECADSEDTLADFGRDIAKMGLNEADRNQVADAYKKRLQELRGGAELDLEDD